MLIKSSAGAAALEFAALDRSPPSRQIDELTVKLHGPVEVGVNVYDDHFESLSAFFRDLAHHWRGWDGTKGWESLEGELSLAATADNAGHITLRVVLLNYSAPERWRAEASISLDAGLLDEIAKGVERFLASAQGAA